MKCLPLTFFLTLALVCVNAAPLPAAQGAVASEPDWMAIVGSYPQAGTLQAQFELAIMVWLQRSRTVTDVARATGETHPSLGCFTDVLGAPKELAGRPMTAALLDHARRDLTPIVSALKEQYARPRPYVTNPVLVPALPLESSSSYPSTHSALGTVYAHLLTQFRSADRAAITERGRLIGDDRTMAGVHWPSDVAAGQRLGHAFATWWINQPEHRQEIKAVCGAEWSSR